MAGMSIAKTVQAFVSEKPFIAEGLKQGLVNYSALARKIIKEQKLKEADFEAVVVALRRLAEKAAPSRQLEGKIVSLLKKGKLEMKNKISVVVLDSGIELSQLTRLVNEIAEKGETLHLVHGSSAYTVITSNESSEKISKAFRHAIVSEKKGLVEIIFKTGREIESTPGVVAFLYSRFSENGINIIETLSSWTETLFVIEEKDVQKAMEALRF
ncbi:MAG: hypothetical protein HY394_02980 [Candidatus Diapherotrites archaeon]|nr:hypothetical protein [Candidatus Diapherotrites archaeon]